MSVESPPGVEPATYDFAEAAARIGNWCTERWIKDRVYVDETLPVVQAGGRTVVRREALEEFIANLPDGTRERRRAAKKRRR